ncbi:MAG: dihydroorotate dehydrogenase (quinone) [Gammaproteobacteria bacterium 39-13]|nr:quinone-dependent dihydroorotate dehydrogenase [Gammaproteobacteria bacterium]OJV85579.1 MAG: dihydroorotate dehydrogenase (quinone) [Gammaproteobacteria bacterium 39-13]
MWYKLIRPLLFALDPEFSHNLTLGVLEKLHQCGAFSSVPLMPSSLSVNCFGLTFPNPIGLAAGLDKNGECVPAWQSFGFGFVEIGTVTPRPQAGNSKPRLFRLPANEAVINRMGFNNKGVDYLVQRVASYKRTCPLGINIGKNKDTPLEAAAQDYLACFQKVYALADYVTVNLSSPNTPGLKSLQHGEMLRSIIIPLKNEQERLSGTLGKKVPILVKISPDLEAEELKLIVNDLLDLQIEGIIATNTTIKRDATLMPRYAKEEGGLSGKPLFRASTEVVRKIHQLAGSDLPIIAVGGVSSVLEAKEKFAAGAKLVQLYSGLIYQGPGLVTEITQALAK